MRRKKRKKFTVGSSDKYRSTISRMWSSRKTPNVCTKFWSSWVRHVQIDIIFPLPTRLARTSISVKRRKKIEKIIKAHFDEVKKRSFSVNGRMKIAKENEKITLVRISFAGTFYKEATTTSFFSAQHCIFDGSLCWHWKMKFFFRNKKRRKWIEGNSIFFNFPCCVCWWSRDTMCTHFSRHCIRKMSFLKEKSQAFSDRREIRLRLQHWIGTKNIYFAIKNDFQSHFDFAVHLLVVSTICHHLPPPRPS